ncbi:unnamed protein product [Pedinophyceae sp. YPF-701]|nr:unnamed protein product [Pedinophyceae sp. YPF-701]
MTAMAARSSDVAPLEGPAVLEPSEEYLRALWKLDEAKLQLHELIAQEEARIASHGWQDAAGGAAVIAGAVLRSRLPDTPALSLRSAFPTAQRDRQSIEADLPRLDITDSPQAARRRAPEDLRHSHRHPRARSSSRDPALSASVDTLASTGFTRQPPGAVSPATSAAPHPATRLDEPCGQRRRIVRARPATRDVGLQAALADAAVQVSLSTLRVSAPRPTPPDAAVETSVALHADAPARPAHADHPTTTPSVATAAPRAAQEREPTARRAAMASPSSLHASRGGGAARARILRRARAWGRASHLYVGAPLDADGVLRRRGRGGVAVAFREWRVAAACFVRWAEAVCAGGVADDGGGELSDRRSESGGECVAVAEVAVPTLQRARSASSDSSSGGSLPGSAFDAWLARRRRRLRGR